VTRHPTGIVTIASEIEQALVRSQAVVALESSLIAHGLPAEVGPDVARASEARVREAGAIPATVAIIDGVVRVGIGDDEFDRLAGDPDVAKVGARDLAGGVMSGGCGGTTVGGTLAVCRVAGIHFMATGGIGGVHRGWTRTGDVSADLHELARTAACVVCSGAKSLLDIGATLEALEALSVPVIGYGTDSFPLFYASHSGHPLSDRADDPETVAALAGTHWGLAHTGGMLVARPVADADGMDPAELERMVEAALASAAQAGVTGLDVTPHVLTHLHRASNGRTLAVNTRLVVDNAGLAAQIAAAYFRS
jgi:pseudouridylate synthase